MFFRHQNLHYTRRNYILLGVIIQDFNSCPQHKHLFLVISQQHKQHNDYGSSTSPSLPLTNKHVRKFVLIFIFILTHFQSYLRAGYTWWSAEWQIDLGWSHWLDITDTWSSWEYWLCGISIYKYLTAGNYNRRLIKEVEKALQCQKCFYAGSNKGVF